MPNDLYEALLAGALAVEAVLFGTLGIFYTVYTTFTSEAQTGPVPKALPPASAILRCLSKLTAWLAALPMLTAVLCFSHLARGYEGIWIVAPLGITAVVMVGVGFFVAYKLMK
jgi:hypothetical protein